MKAIRVHPNTSDQSTPYSAANPAPSSSLKLDDGIPIPKPANPGELLVRVKASTVIRDALTWPETYLREYSIPGHDLSGTVESVYEGQEECLFKPGDEVYGMVETNRASTWAEYTLVTNNEISLKPKKLTWAEAAAVPLSALTAYQALFEKAGLTPPDFNDSRETRSGGKRADPEKSILLTGAAGGVGTYLVQLAALAGLYVVAATSSNDRNQQFLKDLGAHEVVEYADLENSSARYETIIDTVGGRPLERCWSLVTEDGVLVSIDSASYDFVERHRRSPLGEGKHHVKALFFIVEPSRRDLEQISSAFDSNLLKVFVARTFPLAEARIAYDLANAKLTERGKVVLTIT